MQKMSSEIRKMQKMSSEDAEHAVSGVRKSFIRKMVFGRHGRIKQRIERFTNDGSQKTKPRQQELPKIVAASLTTDRPA